MSPTRSSSGKGADLALAIYLYGVSGVAIVLAALPAIAVNLVQALSSSGQGRGEILLTLAAGQSLIVLTGIQLLASMTARLVSLPLGVIASAPLLIVWGIVLTRTRVTSRGTPRNA